MRLVLRYANVSSCTDLFLNAVGVKGRLTQSRTPSGTAKNIVDIEPYTTPTRGYLI